jgi:hypothetical protein
MHKRGRAKELTRVGLRALPVVLLAVALSGCLVRSMPPGADIAGGKVGQAGFTYLRWQQGLAIMVWHDLDSAMNHGSGTAGDPVYRLRGHAASPDGRRVEWQVETTDGKTARFRVDGVDYDLDAGALFVLTIQDGVTGVKQLDRDLSGVQTDYESCVAFARSQPELVRLIDGPSGPQAEAAIARASALAREDLQARFGHRAKDIAVKSVLPLAPLCRDRDACAPDAPGYVIQLAAGGRLYEYRSRVSREVIILWREV